MKTKIILILICTLVLAACGSPAANQGSATSSPTTIATTPKVTPTSAPAQHFAVGQLVTVGDTWQITIVSAKTSPHGQYSMPQHAGDVYLIFQITVKNISAQEQNISSIAQFQLTDTTGQKYINSYDDEAGAMLDGKVQPGDPLKGSLVYEVPGSIHDYRLAFTAHLFQSGVATWDIRV